MSKTALPTIGVINSNPEIVAGIREFLENLGYPTFTAHIHDLKHGRTDFLDLMEEHEPKLIIYDVAPPYDANWRFLRLLRSSSASAGTAYVVTTTNMRAMRELCGETAHVELLGKPFDLEQLAAMVSQALTSAGERSHLESLTQ